MRIGIVGSGQVGASCGFACVLKGVGTSLVLVDQNPDLARAQAEDINHATPFSEAIPVTSGPISALEGCGIVMVAAGVPQKDASESRLSLLRRNADVFAKIVPQILDHAPSAIILVASNPVDIMTDIALSIAANRHGIGANRIIGSGTILDTARFRALLSQHLSVSSHSVHAYVLGEHGDSEVLHWSGASIGAVGLETFCTQTKPLDQKDRERIDDGVRRAAYRIIAGKGATWFGIGAGMARIAEAIIGDEHAVLTCAARTDLITDIAGVTLSLPRVIGAGGVIHTILPDMSDDEDKALRASAHIIKQATQDVFGAFESG